MRLPFILWYEAMSGFKEETYSTIFASLKHPARRRILRMLSEKPRNFSEMLDALEVSSSHLTYHLDSLRELISKTEDGSYKLSALGKAAVGTMTKVEEFRRVTEPRRHPSLTMEWKSLFVVLMIGLVVLSGIGYAQYQCLSRLSAEYEQLYVEYEKLKDFVELVEKGASLQSIYTLRYEFDKTDTRFRIQGPWVCLVYSPYDNSKLRLTLSVSTIPSDSHVSVTVQEGNLFDLGTNETAPVIWKANATASSTYSVPLASKGWYTISIIGPVRRFLDDSGKVVGYGGGPVPSMSEDVDCSMSLRMIYEGKYSPFIVRPFA